MQYLQHVANSIMFSKFYIKKYIGSIVFMIVANIWTIIISGYATLMMMAHKKEIHKYANYWGQFCLKLLKFFTDLEVRYHGPIPKNAIIASQHQSALEILALIAVVEQPIFVLKKSLTKIPFLGWVVKKLGMIPVDRKSINKHWITMAKNGLENNKSLIIFPEGTRVGVGEETHYKSGVFKLATTLNMPIVPVAIDTGKFWKRKSLFKDPGVANIIFGEPMINPDPAALRDEYKNLIAKI